MDAIRYIRADRSFTFTSIVLTKKLLAFDAVDAFALSAVTYKNGYTTEEQLQDTEGGRKRAWKAAAAGRYEREATGRTNEDRLRAFYLTSISFKSCCATYKYQQTAILPGVLVAVSS